MSLHKIQDRININKKLHNKQFTLIKERTNFLKKCINSNLVSKIKDIKIKPISKNFPKINKSTLGTVKSHKCSIMDKTILAVKFKAKVDLTLTKTKRNKLKSISCQIQNKPRNK